MLEMDLKAVKVELPPDNYMEPPTSERQPDVQHLDNVSQMTSHGATPSSSTFTSTKTSEMDPFMVPSQHPNIPMSSFMPPDLNAQFNYASSSSSINMHQYHPMSVHHPSDIPLYSIPNQGPPPPPSSQHPHFYSGHPQNLHFPNTLAERMSLPKDHQNAVLHPINPSNRMVDPWMNDIPMNGFSRNGTENRLPSPPEERFTSFQPNKVIGKYTAQQLKAALQENLSSEEHIDTVKLCFDVSETLKYLRIPQTVFAETIIARSQGTLSDILKNPRPFEELKSGKETYRRMENWRKLDAETKRALAVLTKEEMESLTGLKYSKGKRKKENNDDIDGQSSGKRSRMVFSNAQKTTLQNVFKYFNQRPSKKEMTQIAAHLDIEYLTVRNFFLNARRRQNTEKLLSEETPSSFDPSLISHSETLTEFLERMSAIPNLPSFF